MPDRFPPYTPAPPADSVRENARAKAVRASYEFWSTGNEALLSKPSRRPLPTTRRRCASPPPMACGQAGASGRWKRSRNDHPQNDLGENKRLAAELRRGARMVSVLLP